MAFESALESKGGIARFATNLTTGTKTLVAAPGSSQRIRVLSYRIQARAVSVTADWRSGTTNTISGLFRLASGAQVAEPYSPAGHFDCAVGKPLVLFNTCSSGANSAAVYGTYQTLTT